ncbi:transcriptional regulator protein DgoR [Azotobacter vinelandii CA]|uniref:Transcriptional regulator protein DgoR n=2 Tax=Azotobacter vinelandii TaxID=354 RepID=C1DMD7_AZOVD|nr:IclR family transcriptional regulator [Azotobacter vinelandii]ACO81214.1 transcriptional regulator protein DgoR [Azotobacter vinelandii DJ]AGK13393.1 transcriptional regulator protein DgoR [Azotobacter vinelandii CA]AGK17761.1 transcriptional regulator protein DgoR [Azotobacter vinelandii CA6]WKN21957.1 IclR family transcriptional regulator [Azotobacter vinelandii]SFX64959.1 transcriptional regulator, IclR family [Azotobacter vinelandii]
MPEHDNNIPPGAQALFRGLAVIDAVAQGDASLPAIGARIGCTRSTTHRLAAALVQAGYLRSTPNGYLLGARLIELGFKAREQLPLVKLAQPHLERLSQLTQDTIHLGVREGGDVLYIEKLPGTRGLEMRSRVGLRMPLALTGVGKALMLDLDEAAWHALYEEGLARRAGQPGLREQFTPWDAYRVQMREYAAAGSSFDLEENELGVRCVAAPIRDAGGAIVAALSVTGAIPFMPEARLRDLRPEAIACARAISHELGWNQP